MSGCSFANEDSNRIRSAGLERCSPASASNFLACLRAALMMSVGSNVHKIMRVDCVDVEVDVDVDVDVW